MTTAANKKGAGIHNIKFFLLLFWAVWFTITCLSNLSDILTTASIITNSQQFGSGSYHVITNSVQSYNHAASIALFIYISAIILQGWIAVLFFVAAHKWFKHKKPWFFINFAFGINILLWGLALVFDEIFLSHTAREPNHAIFMTLAVATLLALHALPDKNSGVN